MKLKYETHDEDGVTVVHKYFVVIDVDRSRYYSGVDKYDGSAEWSKNYEHAELFETKEEALDVMTSRIGPFKGLIVHELYKTEFISDDGFIGELSE